MTTENRKNPVHSKELTCAELAEARSTRYSSCEASLGTEVRKQGCFSPAAGYETWARAMLRWRAHDLARRSKGAVVFSCRTALHSRNPFRLARARLNELNLGFRCFTTLLRFLLKSVQYVAPQRAEPSRTLSAAALAYLAQDQRSACDRALRPSCRRSSTSA